MNKIAQFADFVYSFLLAERAKTGIDARPQRTDGKLRVKTVGLLPHAVITKLSR
jgi:hypothetical protein